MTKQKTTNEEKIKTIDHIMRELRDYFDNTKLSLKSEQMILEVLSNLRTERNELKPYTSVGMRFRTEKELNDYMQGK